MQLRLTDIAAVADGRDDLTALDVIAALHMNTVGMRVGGHEPVVVPDEDQIAVTLQLVADITDFARIGRVYRCSARDQDVDAVVASAVRIVAERRDDAAFDRPEETL